MNKVVLSAVVPLLSLALIAIFAITLGYAFYQIHHNTEIGTIGVIGLGLTLLILTPVIAFLLERSSEK